MAGRYEMASVRGKHEQTGTLQLEREPTNELMANTSLYLQSHEWSGAQTVLQHKNQGPSK